MTYYQEELPQALMAILPDYAAGIPEECRARYQEKLSMIGNIGIIMTSVFQDSVDLWPATTYMVFTPSPYTGALHRRPAF